MNKAKLIKKLKEIFDTLESTTDSELDFFEGDEEEQECSPVQWSARKVMELIDELETK
jgi:hypothetical protein